MALPRLNDAALYDLTIPSTGESIKFRPFLVREQKILLVAYESKDIKHIMNAVLECIKSCVENVDIDNLATFDVDYIFTQIRSKSVGESTEMIGTCSQCKSENSVIINLDEIRVDVPKKEKHIQLNSNISVEMKYPTYTDIINDRIILNVETTQTQKLFATIRSCMHSVQTEDESILMKDETIEEIEEFISSLNDKQYGLINDFIDSMPNMRYEKKYQCAHCETTNSVEIEGLQDFF